MQTQWKISAEMTAMKEKQRILICAAVLCLQWFNTYSQLLSGYMRRDTGVGMDLTLVRTQSFFCVHFFPLPKKVFFLHFVRRSEKKSEKETVSCGKSALRNRSDPK